MQEEQEQNESVDRLKREASMVAEAVKMAKDMPKQLNSRARSLSLVPMLPIALVELKKVDPETYYTCRASLKQFAETLKENAEMLEETLEKFQ